MHRQPATFAAGCFWGVQAVFDEIEGVLETTAGYTGGHVVSPSYEQVAAGLTDHAEAVEVLFDPAIVSYGELLETFWHTHDATTPNRQGWDVGSQYRSAIFCHDQIQKGLALASRRSAQLTAIHPIVTEIVPASRFYRAEEPQQHYHAKFRASSVDLWGVKPHADLSRCPARDTARAGSAAASDHGAADS